MPGVGGDKEEDNGLTREELQEQEKLRYGAVLNMKNTIAKSPNMSELLVDLAMYMGTGEFFDFR